MRAAIMSAPRKPLKIGSIPVPRPGPGQVVLRMQASGLCGTDLHIWHGTMEVPLPIVFGHEPVGIVDQLGAGVTRLTLGQRVGVSWVQSGCGQCAHCQRRQEKYCPDQRTWVHNGGGNSDFMLAEAAGCTLLPASLDWTVAAPLFCAGFTVMSGYRNADPRPGDRIAVIGIGGLGHLALQVAKAHGHEVIAVTSSENKRDEARALGADEVLVVNEHAGKELAAMGGVDIVLSTSNSMKQNSQVLEGLRPEGRLVTMALGQEPIEADPLLMLIRQLSIIGSMQNNRADLVEILELAAAGKVKPALELYRFHEINTALRRLDEGLVRYRAVLHFED